MAFALIVGLAATAQHTITVKKKEDTLKVEVQPEEPEIELSGFYYSDPYTLSTGTPGEPPSDFRRMIIYIDSDHRIYLFHSIKPLAKLYEKFASNPDKFTEEYGSVELTSYGDIYISSKHVYAKRNVSGMNSFKYVGSMVSMDSFYLEYKASYQQKVALNIYLHKY